MENRVYFPAYAVGALNGLQEAMAMMTYAFVGEEHSIKGVFCGSIVQCGASKLIIEKQFQDTFSDIPFLQQRAEFRETESSVPSLIHEVFQSFLPDGYQADEDFLKVSELEAFVSSICLALEMDADLIFPSDIPDFTSLYGVIPPELMIPISTFLKTFQLGAVPTASPSRIISIRDVTTFQEVLESIWFEQFCIAHLELNNGAILPETLIPTLREKTSSLVSNFDAQLRISSVSTGMLEMTGDLAELGTSSPGATKQLFSLLLDLLARRRKRMVVYNTKSISKEILRNTVVYAAKNKGSENEVLERLNEIKRTSRSEQCR